MIDKQAEENMLSKLKMELGINAVNKMTTMFKDIALSENFTNEFRSNKANTVGDIEMASVNVLTNGNWPIDEQTPCQIPKSLEDMQAKFKRYYDQKFNNRQLKWLYQFGTIELNAKYDKTYFMTVNVFQATILELYNQKDVYTYGELLDKTGIPEKEIQSSLLMFCKPQVKLLIK